MGALYTLHISFHAMDIYTEFLMFSITSVQCVYSYFLKMRLKTWPDTLRLHIENSVGNQMKHLH